MHPETVQQQLSVWRLLNEPQRRILQPGEPALQKLLSLDRLLRLYREANVDRSVDRRTAPAALLDRYMGKANVAEFRAWHAAKDEIRTAMAFGNRGPGRAVAGGRTDRSGALETGEGDGGGAHARGAERSPGDLPDVADPATPIRRSS